MDIQRDIISQLLTWKESTRRQPLILQGARQIGKSWAVTEFVREVGHNTENFYSTFLSNILIGTPTAYEWSGTDLLTNAPAPMMARSPISMSSGAMMVECIPM